jgi:disulfide bond formation protein DsbB
MITRLTRDDPRAGAARLVGGLPVAVGLGALGAALIFQYGFGLAPCPLCIDQRIAHGSAVVFGLAAIITAGRSITLALLALTLADLALATGAGIAFYHAGIEYKFWQGPVACSGGGDMPMGSLDALKAALESAPIIRCDEAPWSFLGISMAGFNFLLSGAAATVMAILTLGVAQWTKPGPRRRPWRSF